MGEVVSSKSGGQRKKDSPKSGELLACDGGRVGKSVKIVRNQRKKEEKAKKAKKSVKNGYFSYLIIVVNDNKMKVEMKKNHRRNGMYIVPFV